MVSLNNENDNIRHFIRHALLKEQSVRFYVNAW